MRLSVTANCLYTSEQDEVEIWKSNRPPTVTRLKGQQQVDVSEATAVGAPVDSRLAQAGANQTSDGIDKHESTTKLWGKWWEPSVILTAIMVATLIFHAWLFQKQWNAMKDSIS